MEKVDLINAALAGLRITVVGDDKKITKSNNSSSSSLLHLASRGSPQVLHN